MSEKINILTRTSNRPNYFRDCCASIDSQIHDNIKHIVGTDEHPASTYIKKHRESFLYIDPLKYRHDQHKSFWYGGSDSPAWWNSYLNDMYDLVEEGWIMFLDDDDHFISSESLSEIVSHIKNDDTLLFWDVQFPGYIIPRKNSQNLETSPPVPANISGIGLMFHSKYIQKAQWEPWGSGDFRVSHALWNIIKNKTHIQKTLTGIQHAPNLGNRKDKDS